MMTTKENTQKTRMERAFTLLEVLLAVGIMASILAVGTVITTNLARQIVNEKAANQMLTLQRAGEEYARANFTILLAALPIAGNSQEVTIAQLKDNGFLADDFNQENLLNLDMEVYILNDTTTGAGQLNAFEVVTVTSNTPSAPRGQTFNWILDTALFGKGKLGILSNSGAGFNNISFTSTNGSWNVPINALTGYSAALPTASSDPSGYIAAYGRITTEDVFDPNVLYRISINNNPEFNRMQTGLNLNNNGLTDVGTLTADTINAGNVTLNGTGRYALSSTGTMNFGAGTTSMAGDVLVYGIDPATGTSLSATNANLGAGNLVANSVNTNRLESGADGIVTNTLTAVNMESQDLIANGNMRLSVNQITTSNIQLGGGAAGTTLSANNITSGNLVTGQADINNNLTVSNNGVSVVNNMNVGGNAAIRSLSTNEAIFNDLCFTTGAKDRIEGC